MNGIKFSVYTSVFNAWVVGVNLASALLTRLEALATRRFQRLSFYTVHFTAVLTRRSYVEEARTSGHSILIRYAIMFDTEKFICEIEQRPAIYDVISNDVTDIL